jgi:hypothetical protein
MIIVQGKEEEEEEEKILSAAHAHMKKIGGLLWSSQ